MPRNWMKAIEMYLQKQWWSCVGRELARENASERGWAQPCGWVGERRATPQAT